MNRRYGTTKTGRAIDILIWVVWVPPVIWAIFASLGIVLLNAIGGYLVLAAASITLIVIGARAWGAPRYLTWVAAVAGGAVSLAALNNVAASTSDSGKLHVLAIGIWVLGGIIGLVNFHPRERDTESVHDVAERTRPGRKSSKVLIVLVVIALAMAGVIFGLKAAAAVAAEPAKQLALDLKAGQSHVSDIVGSENLADEATDIRETIETECFGSQVDGAYKLTSDPEMGDGEAFDATSARCQGIGVENAAFPEQVTNVAEGILDLADGLGLTQVLGLVRDNVTDKTVEQVEQGDIEQAVRDLYAGVENGEVQ